MVLSGYCAKVKRTDRFDLQQAGQDGSETATDREGGACQGEQPLEGRARVSCGEEPVSASQVPLQGASKEDRAVARAVRDRDLVL